MRRLISLAVCAFVVAVLFSRSIGAIEQAETGEPQLRIDAGMHTAVIRRIAADKACSVLVTGSEDKSIRVWRRQGLSPASLILPPILRGRVSNSVIPNNNGKIYSVAVAPDGTWIAAGGWSITPGRHWIYVFETASGIMKTQLGPFAGVIEHLAVSDDGQRLAAALASGQGVRSWQKDGSVASWKPQVDDRKYNAASAVAVSFDPAGTLYSLDVKGVLRSYGDDAAPIHSEPGPNAKRATSLAVHPSGNLLAVGYDNSAIVDVVDARTFGLLYSTDPTGVSNGALSAVAWSADGTKLLAGGSYANGKRRMVRMWPDSGRGKPKDIEGPEDRILHIAACADGFAVAGGEPSLIVYDGDGNRIEGVGRIGADMRNKLGPNFTVSRDAQRVRFGLKEGIELPVLFDLKKSTLARSPSLSGSLFPAQVEGIAIENWQGSTAPKFAGIPIKLDQGERAQSIAIAADRRRFVLGTDYYIRGFDGEGRPQWKTQAPGVIWGLSIALDRPVVVAACSDGTLRWYRLDTGAELLAVFIHAESRRWVAWTPKGYYMASAGGENLVGWHVNRGLTRAADYYPVSKFRDTFYRPDIVERILAEGDEDAAIDKANQAAEATRAVEDIRTKAPPVIRILSPATHTGISADEVSVAFAVRSPSGSEISKVFAQIDGRPAEGAVTSGPFHAVEGEFVGSLRVKLPRTDTTVSVTAVSENGKSVPATVQLYRMGLSNANMQKPKLYAVIIGIGDYKNDSLDLGIAPGNDADVIEELLKLQIGRAYSDVEVRKLKDAQATSAAIIGEMQWLLDSAKDYELDRALVYFSGHGLSMPRDSFLVPYDFEEGKLTTALSKSSIVSLLSEVQSRVVLFLDACHAGDTVMEKLHRQARQFNVNGFVNELADPTNGFVAFGSSQGNELSYIPPGGINSFFTQAVKEGLSGLATRRADRIIFTKDLDVWLYDRVQFLSEGKQNPVMVTSSNPFPLAVGH